MNKVFKSNIELIGGTPILRASRYAAKVNIPDVTIFEKL